MTGPRESLEKRMDPCRLFKPLLGSNSKMGKAHKVAREGTHRSPELFTGSKGSGGSTLEGMYTLPVRFQYSSKTTYPAREEGGQRGSFFGVKISSIKWPHNPLTCVMKD